MDFTPKPALYSSLLMSSPTLIPSSSNVNSSIIASMGGTVAGALILTVAFVIGIPGNIFVIWSIVARTKHHSVTTTLILNLACADGMLMLLTPFFIIYLLQRNWMFGLAMCKVLYYFCCANMYASIFLITLMSLHRLVAVVRPQRLTTFRKRTTVVRMLLVIWILALALAVPALVFRGVTKTDKNTTACDCIHSKTEHTVIHYSMETVLGFLLPYSLIVVSYGRVLLKIRRTRFRRRIRSEKLILIIVVTFALFWLPYHVVNMLQVSEELLESETLRDLRIVMRLIVSPVAFFSSCINPILYMCVGKAYMRQAGLAFMARLFEATGRDVVSRRAHRQQHERGEVDGLRDKESDSTTSTNATRVQNGKQ